jgi:Transposase
MTIKRYKAEQIVTLLRQIEVGIANGKPTQQACKDAEITIQTYYRWRKEYGGLKLDQAKRLKAWRKRTQSSSKWWQSRRWRSRFSRILRRETSRP